MLKIRKARVEDAMALGIIWKETYQTSYRGYLPDSFLDNIVIPEGNPFFANHIQKDGSVYLCEEGGEIKGFLDLLDIDEKEKCLYISAIYVHPSCQKQGIGRCLLEYVSEEYKVKVSRIEISTLKDGPSVGFYQKCGFVFANKPNGVWKMANVQLPTVKMVKYL